MLERFLGPVLVPERYARYLVLGCALGVASILVVLSLFANYLRAVETQLLGVHPHVSIRPAEVDRPWSREVLRQLERLVAELDGVVVAGPALDRIVPFRIAAVETHSVTCRDQATPTRCFDPGSASGAERPRSAQGFTIDETKSIRVRLRGLVIGDASPALTIELDGVLDVRADSLGPGRMAEGPEQGRPMAGYFERRLFFGSSSYDDFLLMATSLDRRDEPAVGEASHHFLLLSTLHLGLRQDAHPLLVTSLDNARRLVGADGEVDTFEIRLADPRRASAVAAELADRLAALDANDARAFLVRSWLEQDEGTLRLLGVLRWVIVAVSSSVMIVAALGVMSTLSLVVLEGRQKIAMLRAMGLRERSLYVALACEGARIATAGIVGGSVLGAASSWALLRIPGFQRGLSKMGVLDPRVMLQGADLAVVAAVTLLLFLLVALWPARQACRILPVSGLRTG